jgi:hypothetical protein
MASIGNKCHTNMTSKPDSDFKIRNLQTVAEYVQCVKFQ